MSSYNVMTQIHVWMGVVTSGDKLNEYFRLDPLSYEAGHGASQFDRDTGLNWYVDDLIGVFYIELPSLQACLNELPISNETTESVRTAYLATGSSPPNAMFYYTDAELHIPNPTQLFNGLHYLGVFNNS